MDWGGIEMAWSVGWRAVLLLAVSAYFWKVAEWVWWKPRRLERALRAQGLRGPPYRFLFGDHKESFRLKREAEAKPLSLSHNITERVSPHLALVLNRHGKKSFSWSGPCPVVNITDPELVSEVFKKFGQFEKVQFKTFQRYIASGLVAYGGDKWAHHRRIINPAFHLEKLKRMMQAFATCCDELISRWEEFAGSRGSCELDVWPDIQCFTGDVISRTAFGSSYKEGRRIFHLQTEQSMLIVQSFPYSFLPGYRFLPTRNNRRKEEIRREVGLLLKSMIEQRERAMQMGEATDTDLLGLLMESNQRHSEGGGDSKMTGMTTEDVIEECKLFYFAGQETTSVLLTWTMVALSMHPRWQVLAREEVLQVFGDNKPDFDGLSRLKTVTMILYEVLRLYPPVVSLFRQSCKEIKLGDITFPPGVQLLLPIMFIHQDPEIWGEDAGEFNPERFAEGVSKASKNGVAFFPFGGGPRVCIGQSFALLEAKMCIARILQCFSLELSPSYAHSPCTILTLHPQHGAQIILHKL